MNSPKRKWLNAILLVAVVVLVLDGYRNHQREAVSRYLQSQQFYALLDLLPKATVAERRTSITATETQVTVHVDVQTQEEFDRLLQASRRAGRPSVEQLEVVWKGVQHRF